MYWIGAMLRAVIRINPHDDEAHFHLGNALTGQGKLEEAITEFRAAIRINPDDAEAHCNLGLTLRAQGKLAEASVAFRGPRPRPARLRPRPAD